MSDHGDRINDVQLAGLVQFWREKNASDVTTRNKLPFRQTLETFERLFELGGFDALREGAAHAPLRHDGTTSQPFDWFEDFRGDNGNYECACVDCGIHFIGYKRRVICKVCAINKLAGIKTFRIDTNHTTPEHRIGFEHAIKQMGDINERLQSERSMLQHQLNELKRVQDLRESEMVGVFAAYALEMRSMREAFAAEYCGSRWWASLTDLQDKRVIPWIDFGNDSAAQITAKLEMRQASWKTRALLRWHWILERSAALRFCARMVASNRAP